MSKVLGSPTEDFEFKNLLLEVVDLLAPTWFFFPVPIEFKANGIGSVDWTIL